jgi:Na+/proline symporter
MSFLDWAVVGLYCAITLGVGLFLAKRASKGIESYFVSGRELPWWLAGTSMIATAWGSDTPLFVTGVVRQQGIWGNWSWWCFMFAHFIIVFFFARLWRRSEVVTEVELTELRYGGREAGVLRGFKAVFWGLLFNIVTVGGLNMVGVSKTIQVVAGIERGWAIVMATALTAVYCIASGFWGVVATDFLQFILMVVGSIVLCVVAVNALGGIEAVASAVEPSKLSYLPPASSGDFWESNTAFFLSFVLIQWWAFKNADGGGIFVQRMVAVKDERQGQLSVLWFNLGHYVLRAWPWILVALASLAVAPGLLNLPVDPKTGKVDHEAAYAAMVRLYLPIGLQGFVVASFLAAFMSTMSTHINWGASYLVNDLYKRFVRPRAPDAHYLRVSRLASILVAAGAIGVAFVSDSVYDAFNLILLATAGIGPALILRWFWWRANAWTEITSMMASLLLAVPFIPMSDRWTSLAKLVSAEIGLGGGRLGGLLVTAVGTLSLALAATMLTRPVSRDKLVEFYRKVRPPRLGWGPIAREAGNLRESDATLANILLSIVGTISIAGMNGGIVLWIQGLGSEGTMVLAYSAALFLMLVGSIAERRGWMWAAAALAAVGAAVGWPAIPSAPVAAAAALVCLGLLAAAWMRPPEIVSQKS